MIEKEVKLLLSIDKLLRVSMCLSFCKKSGLHWHYSRFTIKQIYT